MRKLIPIFLLAIVSNSATAEWVEAGRHDNFDLFIITAYADPTSIQKTGNIVKMRVLMEYQPTEIVNGKEQRLAIVKAESVEVTQGGFDRKNKLSGASDTHDWAPVTPDSMDEGLWKIACGK